MSPVELQVLTRPPSAPAAPALRDVARWLATARRARLPSWLRGNADIEHKQRDREREHAVAE